MKATLDIPADALALAAALQGIVAVDLLCIDTARDVGRPFPPLYRSGIRYKREHRAKENWLIVPQIVRDGVADCEDLCCWRAAELQHAGEDARVFVRKVGPKLFHVLVVREDGTFEDPSRVLGMGANKRG